MRLARILGAAVLALGVVSAQISRFRPAQYLDGPLPSASPLAVGGGEVLLELTITTGGGVGDVKTLRSTPPFTAGVAGSVKGWQFRPAERLVDPPPTADTPGSQTPQWQRVASKVLVAEVIRPPTINTPTLGQPAKDLDVASDEAPFPTKIVTPLYPPMARNDGAVLVEVTVGVDGSVTQAKVVRSPPGAGNLEASALTAARAWSFRPARLRDGPIPTTAYLIFVFRQPVLATGR